MNQATRTWLGLLLIAPGAIGLANAQDAELAVQNRSVVEGNSGTATLEIDVRRTGETSQEILVDHVTAIDTGPNPATPGVDYTPISTPQTVSIPAGQATGTVAITVFGDTEIEANETLLLELVGASAMTTGPEFDPAASFPAGGGGRMVAASDLTGDGHPDLVVANSAFLSVTVLEGDGAGNFVELPNSPIAIGGAQPHDVVLSDVDGDGHLDILTANNSTDDVSVLTGDGTGHFTAVAGSPFATGDGPESLGVAELTGDAHLDIVTANSFGNDISILAGDGTGSFSAPTGVMVQQNPRDVEIAELTGDAHPDLAVVNSDSNVLTILQGDGSGGFSLHTNIVTGNDPDSVAAADVSGDGHPDLITANSANTLSIFLGDGAGNFTEAAGSPVAGLDRPLEVIVADVNGDRDPDIVASNFDRDDLSVLIGNGTGGFTPPQSVPVGDGPVGIASVDLDGDMAMDLITANAIGDDVSVLLAAYGVTFIDDTGIGTIVNDDVNDPPDARDDQVSVPEDGVLANRNVLNDNGNGPDTDPEDDPLTVTDMPVSGPHHGTLNLDDDGSFVYTPDPDYSGLDDFVYQVCDPEPLCDTATVVITVTPINDQPEAMLDEFTIDEDTILTGNVKSDNGNGPDQDVDGDPLDVTPMPVEAPVSGSVVLEADGDFTYTPDMHANGNDSFRYEICDPEPSCDLAYVQITVNPVEDPPDAHHDEFDIQEDMTLFGDVLADNGNGPDTDPDGDSLDVTPVPLSSPQHGQLLLDPDGTFEYQPDEDYFGPDGFDYEVCDPDDDCTSASVIIDVTSINDPPEARNDEFTGPEDTAVTGNVLADNGNGPDTDVEGDPLTVTTTPIAAPTHGLVDIQPDGSFTYTPDAHYNGPDSFDYEVCDDEPACSQAVVSLTLTPEPDAPLAADDDFTLARGHSLSGTLTDNNGHGADTDPDGGALDVTTTPIVAPAHGQVFIENVFGDFVYNPIPGYTGMDSFEYEVCNTTGLCDTALVSLEISVETVQVDFGDAYVIEGDAGTVDMAFPLAFPESAIDGWLRVDYATVPTGSNPATPGIDYETVAPGTRISLDTSQPNAAVDVPVIGDMVAEPNEQFGLDVSAVALLDSSALFPGRYRVETGDTPKSVAAGDFDGDGNVDMVVPDAVNDTVEVFLGLGDGSFLHAGTIALSDRPHGVVVTEITGDSALDILARFDSGGQLAVLAGDGSGGFSPVPGSPFSAGGSSSTVAVGDVNDDGFPDMITDVPFGDSFKVHLGDGIGGFPSTNAVDIDGDRPLWVDVADFDGDGVDDIVTANVNSDNVSVFTWDDFNSFEPFPSSPVAVSADPANVVAGDVDGDGNKDIVTLSQVTGMVTVLLGNGSGGFVQASGSPFDLGDAVGDYGLAVADVNGDGLNDIIATLPLGPTPLEDPVAILLSQGNGDFESPVYIDTGYKPAELDVADVNQDGTPDLLIADSQRSEVMILPNSPGRIAMFTGGTAVGTILDDDSSQPVAPQARDDAFVQVEPGAFQGNVLVDNGQGPDSDPNGDSLSVTVSPVTPPSNGSVALNPDGTFTYTPNAGFSGPDGFVYEVCDPGGLCDTAQVELQVDLLFRDDFES